MKKENRISRLTSYAGEYKYLTYSSLVLSAMSAAVSVVPFYYIWLMLKEVLDAMPDYSQATGLVHNGWMALGFTVLSVALYITALMCSHIGAFRIAKNMRKKTIEHAIELPPGTFDSMGSGKIRRIIQDSSGATETYLAHQLPDMAGTVVLPLAILTMLMAFDWRIGIASAIPIAVSIIVLLMSVSRKAASDSMATYQNALGDVNREAVEYIRGISVVKTFQQTVDTFQSFKRSIQEYSRFVVDYTKWYRGKMVIFYTASNSIFAALVAVALYVTHGGPGDVAFLADLMFYVIFTPIMTVLVMRIMFSSNEGYVVDDALSRIDSVLSMRPLDEPAEPHEPGDWMVRFDNVSFTYPEATSPAVEGFDLEMKPGTITALVGPSGSGKSTVASLLCRFWDPSSGTVSIGGQDLRDIGSVRVSEVTSCVLQSNRLLKDTLLNNVRLGRPDAGEEDVRRALDAAQCGDIVSKLPDGLGTIIGPGGVYLSGGEVQRISIARAILKDSPVVVLDEATAFADPENEHLVQKAFEKLAEDKTVLVIAHRLTTVRNADMICVMEKGSISEKGTHQELMGRGGTYLRLWNDYQRSLSWKVAGASQ
ncbi:MAG: ABC transporter ATP-binding protein [Gudongella sp.]|nr:ABC transporter ATP-binding protein [Gudongella sp.]